MLKFWLIDYYYYYYFFIFQYAENLLAGVSASCDNIKYTAWLASETMKHLKQNLTGTC